MIKLLCRIVAAFSLVLVIGLLLPLSASAETTRSEDQPPTQVAMIFGTGINLGLDFGESGSLVAVSLLDRSQSSPTVRVGLGDTETVVDLRRSDGPDNEVVVAVVPSVDVEENDDSDADDFELDGLDLDDLDLDDLDLNDIDLNDIDLSDFGVDDLDLSELDLSDIAEKYDESGTQLNSGLRSADDDSDGPLGTLPRD